MSDEAAQKLDQLRQEARTRWDYPFKRETLHPNQCNSKSRKQPCRYHVRNVNKDSLW